jgi:hypothetical protein
MAAAHWLCAVESGTHARAVDVGAGSAAWSHFASSRAIGQVEKFVSQPAVFCDILLYFSRVLVHRLFKREISSCRISNDQAVDGKRETKGRVYL